MVVVSLPLSLSTLFQFLVNLSPHLSFSPLSLSLVAVKRRYTVDHKSVKPGAKIAKLTQRPSFRDIFIPFQVSLPTSHSNTGAFEDWNFQFCKLWEDATELKSSVGYYRVFLAQKLYCFFSWDSALCWRSSPNVVSQLQYPQSWADPLWQIYTEDHKNSEGGDTLWSKVSIKPNMQLYISLLVLSMMKGCNPVTGIFGSGIFVCWINFWAENLVMLLQWFHVVCLYSLMLDLQCPASYIYKFRHRNNLWTLCKLISVGLPNI